MDKHTRLSIIGIDPLHSGVILTVNSAVGMSPPPFGLNLFVASSLGNVDYRQAVRGSLPFIAIAIVAPAISRWLPPQLYEGL